MVKDKYVYRFFCKNLDNLHIRTLYKRQLSSFNMIPKLFYDDQKLRYDQEILAIRRIFSLVDMITNTQFSTCLYVFEIGVVQQKNMHNISKRFTIYNTVKTCTFNIHPSFYIFILGAVLTRL